MPHEAFPINPADNIGRDEEQVAQDIARIFDSIAEQGGKFVTTITMGRAHYLGAPHACSHETTYVVADLPEKP